MRPAEPLAVLVLLAAAGCLAVDPEPAPPRPAVGGAPLRCPSPFCPAAVPPSPPPTPDPGEEERRRGEAAARRLADLRAGGLPSLETAVGGAVRTTLRSGGKAVVVEIRLVEVAPPSAGEPARARFHMGLRDGEGNPFGTLLVPPPGGVRYEEVPPDRVQEEALGAPFHRYFACPGGTAWEIEAIADPGTGGGVRFTLKPEYLS